MSNFLDKTIERARSLNNTIDLPEGDDPRVIEAAKRIREEKIANVILLEQNTPPEIEELKPKLADDLYELRKARGMTQEEATKLMEDSLYVSMMLLKGGYCDGVVAGAKHATGDVLRPALQIIKTDKTSALVSAFFVMCVPDCEFGEAGTFVFSDCGLNVNPDQEQLSHIAVQSAHSFHNLVGGTPKVAMLSHSTKGSAKNPDAEKVIEATRLARELAPELAIDGELQLDAALVESVASSKCPDSPVAPNANVLIFPDLDAGNIAYKLVQRLAKAEAYGPITQGLAAPVNDLSRGCSAEDIVGVAAITSIQASKSDQNS